MAALDDAVAASNPALDWGDVLNGAPGGPVDLDGGDANDFLAGGAGNDTLRGFGGDDSLQGNGGHDVLDGGAGNDRLLGGDGFDHITGGAGNDTLRDGTGSDLIEGGAGDDLYIWEGGVADFIFDAGGTDTVRLGFSGGVQFERVFGDDMLLRSGSNTLTLQDQFADPAAGSCLLYSLVVFFFKCSPGSVHKKGARSAPCKYTVTEAAANDNFLRPVHAVVCRSGERSTVRCGEAA